VEWVHSNSRYSKYKTGDPKTLISFKIYLMLLVLLILCDKKFLYIKYQKQVYYQLCLNMAVTVIHTQPAGLILHPLISTFHPRIDVKSFRHAIGCILWKISTLSCFSTTKKRKIIHIWNNMPKQDSDRVSKCMCGLCSSGWCFCNTIFFVVLGFDSPCLVVVKVNHIQRVTRCVISGFRRDVNEICALLGF
jgi:hypothetical protein